jgi:hypothetical protein
MENGMGGILVNNKIILIIVISMFFSCVTPPISEKSCFPDDIIHPPPIVEFINNFSTGDIDVARNTYLTVLAFIEEVIAAHNENIARAYRFDTYTVKRPALIDGKLTIIETSVGVSVLTIFDDVLDEYVEVGPSGDGLSEIFQIIRNSILYNKLLDHWFFLADELLGEHIDVRSVGEKLIQEHEPLHNLGFFHLNYD